MRGRRKKTRPMWKGNGEKQLRSLKYVCEGTPPSGSESLRNVMLQLP